MRDGNNVNSMLVMSEDNLKRELLYAARPVPNVDPCESFGIGLDARQRDVNSNAEVTSGRRTAFGIPIRRRLQFGSRFGMKTSSHRQHRALRTIELGCPPNLR